MNESSLVRTIRSFVRREVRITDSQIRALEELWPQYGHEISSTLFESNHPLIIEIGFGSGDSLLNQAKTQPEFNFLGIEVHRPGVGTFLKRVHEAGLTNVRVSKDDCHEVLASLPDSSIHGIQIFFPDPWPKPKHWKRRLIQPAFLDLIIPKLQPGGFIHIATDWQDYAKVIHRVLSADPRLQNTSPNGTTIERPPHRILSKFEKKGLEKGHEVWDYFFIKPARPHV